MKMLEIDGSKGEGGGQILRSALALSVITQQSVRLINIRARRDKPGLARQHLCALRSIAQICGAKVSGDHLGSMRVEFVPGPVQAGNYEFAVGSAGATSLVLQTVLWPLLLCTDGVSQLSISGGTHNYRAPSFEFMQDSFVAQIQKMGAKVQLFLERYGFYPAGGGLIHAVLEPSTLCPLSPRQSVRFPTKEIRVLYAHLPRAIARREMRTAIETLDWEGCTTKIQEVESSGPGNVLLLSARAEGGTLVSTGIGRRGVRAEALAREAAAEIQRSLAIGTVVDPHLADQLMIPLALAKGGEFLTPALSLHAKSNAALIERFLPVQFRLERGEGGVRVRVEEC